MPLTKTETLHMLISVVTISLAFSMGAAFLGVNNFFSKFPVVLITLGAGFVLHEMGHKFTAQHFGCFAEYRAWTPGLLLALGLAVISGGTLVFAAPGAVYIGGKRISVKENGVISLAGPFVNLIIGGLFFLLLLSVASDSLLGRIGFTGAYINFFLAFFNMIPFPPLDGSKVIQWNTGVWMLFIGLAGFLTFFF